MFANGSCLHIDKVLWCWCLDLNRGPPTYQVGALTYCATSAYLFLSLSYIYIITYFFIKIKKDFLFSLTAYTLLQRWVLPIVLYYLLHRIPHIHNSRRVTGLKNCTRNPFSISFLHIYYNILFYKNQKRFSRRIFWYTACYQCTTLRYGRRGRNRTYHSPAPNATI